MENISDNQLPLKFKEDNLSKEEEEQLYAFLKKVDLNIRGDSQFEPELIDVIGAWKQDMEKITCSTLVQQPDTPVVQQPDTPALLNEQQLQQEVEKLEEINKD